MPERCERRGASLAWGAALCVRCGGLGGAGHLGRGGVGPGWTVSSRRGSAGRGGGVMAAKERGGGHGAGSYGVDTPRPLADHGAVKQELGPLCRSSSNSIESTKPGCAR